MNFRPDPKPERRAKRPRIPLKRKPVFITRQPTGELDLFREIVNERGSKSEISGDPIYSITVSNMIHVLAKGQNKYPKFKLYKKNIVIGTREEHDEYDYGSHEELRKKAQWQKFFKLREELLEEYKKL